MTPISHDISYTENSVTTTSQHPLMQHTKHQRMKTIKQSQAAAPLIAPPGKFFSVNGTAQKVPGSYAKVKYRKFYHVLPQNQAGFFPVR